jgi:hypothetical protein
VGIKLFFSLHLDKHGVAAVLGVDTFGFTGNYALGKVDQYRADIVNYFYHLW